MSATTSLTMATSTEQHQGNASLFGKTSIDINGKQQPRSKDSELIDCKFNELAKKILNELKQAQYSKDFFKAIDDIIKEPVANKSAHISQHRQSVSQKHRQTNSNNHPTRPHKQGFNPIVRSNTVGSSRAGFGCRESVYKDSSEPKSMILNSRDIGSLYKPHMNYTTSVLGNHRLSDDDEIIIIPTQSPSLVSTSSDGDANSDELIERFSISRTKSFWEKLSKGNHNKRSDVVADVFPANDNGKMIHQAGNKVIEVRTNGHSNTLDRMDSTGGSNSNYSCSSSGDENGVGGCVSSHSQQEPTLSQLQEMSRQNRFRQTR